MAWDKNIFIKHRIKKKNCNETLKTNVLTINFNYHSTLAPSKSGVFSIYIYIYTLVKVKGRFYLNKKNNKMVQS